MSRSIHYRICSTCTLFQACDLHQSPYYTYTHKPERLIVGRRNWTRRTRYPKYSVKQHHGTPPRWWWQDQHARARRIFSAIMRRDPNPSLPTEKQLISLWSWY